jgi:hypothetical protein
VGDLAELKQHVEAAAREAAAPTAFPLTTPQSQLTPAGGGSSTTSSGAFGKVVPLKAVEGGAEGD